MEINYKTDSEPLNRLQALIRVNAHLMNEEDVEEFNSIYKELVGEYQQYENEILLNEKLMEENALLKDTYVTAYTI